MPDAADGEGGHGAAKPQGVVDRHAVNHLKHVRDQIPLQGLDRIDLLDLDLLQPLHSICRIRSRFHNINDHAKLVAHPDHSPVLPRFLLGFLRGHASPRGCNLREHPR
jgi:hypothetical protein